MTSAAARNVGRYTLDGTSWSGATGTVQLGHDSGSGARVALKLARAGSASDEERFAREVALLARLSRSGHPGVPALLDTGRHDGRSFLVMRFVEGRTLRAVADEIWPRLGTRRPADAQPPAVANGQLGRVLAITHSLARTLAYVHAQGVVHCDLTPSNIVIEASGAAVLIDFGSATSAFAIDTRREHGDAPGGFDATVGYAAPEQLSGQALDSRCDLYALGCILYELCTGQLPFSGDAAAIAAQHLYAAPPRPRARVSELPDALERLILRLCAKDRRERPAFAEDVARELPGSDLPALARAHGAAVHLYQPSLIGRDEALARLMQAARDAAAGHGGWLVVSGESGIGKTRLIAELGRRLVRESMIVVYGACAEGGADAAGGTRNPPLEPFRALLAALERRLAREAAERALRLAPHLGALAPYHPALAELPGVARVQLPVLPLALARKRVLRALRQCLIELSRFAPLVMVLDDLHAADELTREFLAEHLSELKSERVLLLGACRREQTDEELSSLIRTSASAELALERLTASEVRLLIKEMLAEEFPPNGFVDYLHRQSEGNPFFVAEYLRVALDTGAIARNERSGWTFPELNPFSREPYASLPTPDSLSALARMRLASAPEPERKLLQLAAVFGRHFDALELAPIFERLAPDTNQSLREALQELVRRQLLETDALGCHRFAHDKLREAALRELAPEAAIELHRAIAERLGRSALGDAEGSERDAEIGTHWAQAREPARAVKPLKAAARRADGRHAHEQAIDLYALAVEQALAAAEETEALRLSELLADLLCRTAKYDRARKQYAFTIERTQATERLTLARLWRKYAETFWRVHEHKQALLALERAEQHLGSDAGAPATGGDGAEEWISLQQARLTIHYFTDPHGAETRVLIDRLLPAVTQHGTPQQKSYFFQCAANERAGRQRYRFTHELIELERRAVAELASQLPAPVLDLAAARFDLAFMLLLGGRAECEEALPLLLEARDRAEELEDMTLLARSLNYLAIAYRRLGDPERTEAYAERTQRVAELAQIEPYLGAVAANRAWLAWRQGRLEEATTRVHQARAWWVRAEHVFPFQWLANWVRLELQASSDDFPAARATLDDLLAPLQQALPEPLELALRAARAACESGEPSRAERALRLALTLAQEGLYL